MVWPEVNCCGHCAFVQWRRTSVNRTRECIGCGEVKWIAARDLCVACRQRDPQWPYRYAANLKARLDEIPGWLDAYVDHLTDRYAPSGSLAHLRKVSAAISSTGSLRPDMVAEAIPAGAHRLVFGEFCASARIGFVSEASTQRAATRRQARIDATPTRWRPAFEAFASAMVARQDRARRLATRADKDRTIEARLSVLRDFAVFLEANRPSVTGPELVAIGEIEAFLAQPDLGSRPSRALAYLRQFFRWARRRSLVLTDPTVGLWRDSKPLFAGQVLSIDQQRRLFARWSKPPHDAHPYEPLIGLLALLHAVPRSDMIAIEVTDITAETLILASRPEPLGLDPVTSGALDRARSHHASTQTQNPHLLVNHSNRRTTRPVGVNWPSALIANGAATTLRSLRATRLSTLVGALDPITVSAATGIDAKALTYYLSDGDVGAGDERFAVCPQAPPAAST